MIQTASKLSRHELDELCSQYQSQLEGPMRHQQLAINCASSYFSSIPKSERTPEESALEEVFSEMEEDAPCSYLLEDLEIMGGEFVTPELQDKMWFDIQHMIHVNVCRLGLYYPLAQKVAAQYGFKLPDDSGHNSTSQAL